MFKEYLLTNGLGGYSSSDPKNGNTRKYHGVLVASSLGLKRLNIVNRLEEAIVVDGQEHYLSTNIYKDNNVFPKGYELLSNFSLNYYPKWVYEIDGVSIEKSQVMLHKQNQTVVKYKINTSKQIEFKLIPLLTMRDHHEVRRYSENELFEMVDSENEQLVVFDTHKFLKINSSGLNFKKEQDLYKDFYYPVEQKRGYDAHEDLQKIGVYNVQIDPGEHEFVISFKYTESNSPTSVDLNQDYWAIYNNRLQEVSDNFHDNNVDRTKLSELLIRQADQFMINVMDKPSIIAGYHWFDDWGRDTFISFKGLLLATNRINEAKQLLLRWGAMFQNGFLPNRPFADDYNSIDAVFWYGVAVWFYYQNTQDIETIREILPNLEQAIDAFIYGSNGVYVDEFGFLTNTNSDKALTWMDAQIDGKPVTPRSGQAVEIQALWYNFLKVTLELKLKLEDRTFLTQIRTITAKLERHFEEHFWNRDTNCLYDRIELDRKDASIRPNQIWVVYLPFELLGKRKAQQLVKTLEFELLSEVGLYTLSPNDLHFTNNYSGDQATRDMAYHQGTIWPFLLGHFLIAYLKADNYRDRAKQFVKQRLNLLESKLEQDQVKYLSEIYDPKTMLPEGCISQAWSTATLLEVLTELSQQHEY